MWHLQALCEQQGHITERLDSLLFSTAASQINRKRPSEKGYFQAHQEFYAYWLTTFLPKLQMIENNVIDN